MTDWLDEIDWIANQLAQSTNSEERDRLWGEMKRKLIDHTTELIEAAKILRRLVSQDDGDYPPRHTAVMTGIVVDVEDLRMAENLLQATSKQHGGSG